MKMLFVGVFDASKKSSNTSQLLSFKKLGIKVVGYNYRDKAMKIGLQARDEHLASIVEKGDYDLVVYSKCNQVSYSTFERINKVTKTCLWFMDPMRTYDEEMRHKTCLVDYVCCDKENVVREALKLNPRTFHVCEGFDEDVDRPFDITKKYDVGFIGNIYGDRAQQIRDVNKEVKIFNNVYGIDHAKAVSQTKINLNFCTDLGASDRVYKTMAAGGFLLTNDWTNREKYLTNGKDCVIFDSMEDLNKKIEYYLENPEERMKISKEGYKTIQQFNRLNWAKRIVELFHNV